MSISDDGKAIAIGAITMMGIRMYHLDGDGMKWEQISDDIDGDAAGDWLGYSVSLSANGTTLVIGAPYASFNAIQTGKVMVYRIDSAGSSWEQLGEIMYGDNEYDTFGL